MATRRHKVFNLSMILIPWLSLLFIGKRSLRRYSFAGVFIVIFEIINHLYGHKKKWWKFYEKRKSFIRDELPFSVGPYMPLSMWILKNSYGNFKKFVFLNVISDGFFAFLFVEILKKFKIARLNRLNHLQFFIYLHYKAYILYGVQYLYEKIKRYTIFR
jgi:phosphatidylglycerophosphatase A